MQNLNLTNLNNKKAKSLHFANCSVGHMADKNLKQICFPDKVAKLLAILGVEYNPKKENTPLIKHLVKTISGLTNDKLPHLLEASRTTTSNRETVFILYPRRFKAQALGYIGVAQESLSKLVRDPFSLKESMWCVKNYDPTKELTSENFPMVLTTEVSLIKIIQYLICSALINKVKDVAVGEVLLSASLMFKKDNTLLVPDYRRRLVVAVDRKKNTIATIRLPKQFSDMTGSKISEKHIKALEPKLLANAQKRKPITLFRQIKAFNRLYINQS